LIAVGPNRLGADIGIAHGVSHIEIGLHIVRRQLEDEGSVLHFDRVLNRPAAGIIDEFVLEDYFLAFAGDRAQSRCAG